MVLLIIFGAILLLGIIAFLGMFLMFRDMRKYYESQRYL